MLEPLLLQRPPDVRIERGRLAMEPGGAVELARKAWDLDALAAAIDGEARRMNEAAATAQAEPPSPGDALGLLWRSIGPFFALISANPPLPSDLLPADWPFDGARAAFVRLAMVVAPAARRFVEDQPGAAGARGHS